MLDKYLKIRGLAGGGSGGGACDWNTMKNKPFGEETTTVGGDTLTWDGNTEGLVCVADMLYKVSDNVLTDEQIKASTLTVGNGMSVVVADYWDYLVQAGAATDEMVCVDEFAFFVKKDGATLAAMGLTFPEAGIYVAKVGDAYVNSITITGYTGFETTTTVVKPIETKYLPEALQIGEEVTEAFEPIVWDGNTEGKEVVDFGGGNYFVKISDEYVDPTQIDTFSVGGTTISASAYIRNAEFGFMLGDFVIGVQDAYTNGEITFGRGIWGVYMPEGGVYVGKISPKIITNKKVLDAKFLPDGHQFGEMVSYDLTWDGDSAGLDKWGDYQSWRVSTIVPTLSDLEKGGTVTNELSNGTLQTLSFSADNVTEHAPNVYRCGTMVAVYIVMVDTTVNGDALKAGVYFNKGTVGFSINDYEGFKTTTIIPLSEKYMPILTSPSGKKFKLSVDDSGVISATEV